MIFDCQQNMPSCQRPPDAESKGVWCRQVKEKATDKSLSPLCLYVLSHFTPSFISSHLCVIPLPYHAVVGFCASPQCSKIQRKDVPVKRLAPPQDSIVAGNEGGAAYRP